MSAKEDKRLPGFRREMERKIKYGVNATSAKERKEQNRRYLGYLTMPISASHLLNEGCVTAVTHIIERALYIYIYMSGLFTQHSVLMCKCCIDTN